MKRLEAAMRACEQAPGLSVWEHGEQVAGRYRDLVEILKCGDKPHPEWRLPEWCNQSILGRLLPMGTMQTYQLYHDCGKPFCLTVDDKGRRHFPGHAAVSKAVWLAAGGDATVGRLIGLDMDAHTMSPEDVPRFAARPEAASLLLTALCEVHANAAMFGGQASTSFKIKWKHLDKRGRQVLQLRE